MSVTALGVGERVEHRRLAVEVRNEQATRVPGHERVEPGVDIPGQVGSKDLLGQWQIRSRPRSLAPAPCHGRNPALRPRPGVVPPDRVHVVAAGEQRPEQRQLLLDGGAGIHWTGGVGEQRQPCGNLREQRAARHPRQPDQPRVLPLQPAGLRPQHRQLGQQRRVGR
jgi:hypothetical protein